MTMRTTHLAAVTGCGLAAAIALAASLPAFAHSGGLDSSGCHHDRKRGGYHCHGAPKRASTSRKPTAERRTSTLTQPERTTDRAANAYDLAGVANYEGTVISVDDGETVKFKTAADETVTVRLLGVDCPDPDDSSKDDAEAAAKKLRELAEGKPGRLVSDRKTFDIDRYARTIGYLEVDGVDIGLQLLRDGVCVEYSKHLPHGRGDKYRGQHGAANPEHTARGR